MEGGGRGWEGVGGAIEGEARAQGRFPWRKASPLGPRALALPVPRPRHPQNPAHGLADIGSPRGQWQGNRRFPVPLPGGPPVPDTRLVFSSPCGQSPARHFTWVLCFKSQGRPGRVVPFKSGKLRPKEVKLVEGILGADGHAGGNFGQGGWPARGSWRGWEPQAHPVSICTGHPSW